MDASDYDKGNGKIKLRAAIDIVDPKTLIIREICYGTTTESLVRSIDEAAKKGKIKIESISDYTAEKVEIEIKLPRGQYADKVIDSLYAYTDCEVSLNSQVVVIKDNLPWATNVDEVLKYNVVMLKEYLTRELDIEKERLLEKIFQKNLEQIFIENRLYKKIEEIASYEKIHSTIEASLRPYHKKLSRKPSHDDRERLLAIPIRRISRFDIEKNQTLIAEYQERVEHIDKDLKRMKSFTIKYLKELIKKYGDRYPRKTRVHQIEDIDRRAMEQRTVKVGYDIHGGFVGASVTSENFIECSNFDKLLLMFNDGTYQIVNIPDKQYVHHEGNKVIYVGVADKKTVMSVVYSDPKTRYCYAKRFVISKFILDREYRFVEKGMTVEYFTTQPDAIVTVNFVPKARQKVSRIDFNFNDVAIKGVTAKGIRIANKAVKKVKRSNKVAGEQYYGSLV